MQYKDKSGQNQEDETVGRLRTGHAGINGTLHKISKRADGKCEQCREIECSM